MKIEKAKSPVTITPQAIEEIKNIMTQKGIPDAYRLRVGVRGGAGCFGVNYIIGFDKKKDIDEEFVIDGVPVLIEKRQLMFIMGVTLDYVSRADEQGFVFEPKEKGE